MKNLKVGASVIALVLGGFVLCGCNGRSYSRVNADGSSVSFVKCSGVICPKAPSVELEESDKTDDQFSPPEPPAPPAPPRRHFRYQHYHKTEVNCKEL